MFFNLFKKKPNQPEKVVLPAAALKRSKELAEEKAKYFFSEERKQEMSRLFESNNKEDQWKWYLMHEEDLSFLSSVRPTNSNRPALGFN